MVTLKVSLVLRPMSEKDTKQRIKEVAHDLVMQFGIRSISMDDIASKLGMSKKTIYFYYKDKDELVEAVVEGLILHTQCSCNADRQKANDAIHEIFLAMDMLTMIFHSMNPSLLFDLQKYHQVAFTKFLNHKNDFIVSMIRQNIERGISEELYRPEINVDIMARFRVESMFIPFNPEFVRNTRSTLVEIEQEIIRHFLFGLVSQKGYKLTLKYQEQRDKAKTKK
ncbi:MAG: TetR/AcrR family transcriptional regulator [Ferruginibacter sp.]